MSKFNVQTSIDDDLQELYEASKGVRGTGLPIPWAADRVIELIERLARVRAERDMQWLDAFVDIDTHIAFAGDPRQYVRAVWEPVKRRLEDESRLNVELVNKKRHCCPYCSGDHPEGFDSRIILL